jgi:MFS family permease
MDAGSIDQLRISWSWPDRFMLRNRQFVAVCLAVGISFIGIGMVVPVRVLYAQSHGASLAVIGAMASSFLLSSFLFQYPTGWLADLWGRRRLMVIGLALQSIVSLGYLVVSDPIVFVGLRFLEGMVAASVIPSARALVADVIPEERRGEAYGLFSAFLNAGFLLGPALGGVFATFGYTPAFVGSSVFRVLALIMVLTLVRADASVLPSDLEQVKAVARKALFTLPLIGVYILMFGDSLFFGFELTVLPLWMRHNLGASVAVIGIAYAFWGVTSMLMSPFGGRAADRVRRSWLIFIFGLLQLPLYALYGLANVAILVVVVFGVHGLVYAFIQPAVDASLAAASPPNARARAQGLYSAIGQVGAFVAANALSLLYAVNFRLPIFVMGAGYGVCVVAGGLLVRRSETRGLIPLTGRAAALASPG